MDTNKTIAPATVENPGEDDFAVLESEAEKAQAAAESDILTYTHTFKRPFEFEGKTYNELTFNFGMLTGKDVLAIQEELDTLRRFIAVKQTNAFYLARVAARACTSPIGVDALEAVPMVDFDHIIAKTQTFLLSAGL